MSDDPCTAALAVKRALSIADYVTDHNYYWLGTGDYRPVHTSAGLLDSPWTQHPDALKAGFRRCSDCAGFAICWCWKLCRHRPGFNRGNWSTVEDDINVNSIMEDAVHKQELATEIIPHRVRPGDLLCYPTFKVQGKTFIGHVGIVVGVPLNYEAGEYSKLLVVHCHGPNGREPAVTKNLGTHWEDHDKRWPKPEHRTHVIRMKER